MNLAQAIQAAYDADDAYEAELKAQGYKSRWDCPRPSKATGPLLKAYWAKVDADRAMNAAFIESRRVAS